MRRAKLVVLALSLLPLFSCQWWATKEDIQTLREDIKETIREEVKAGAEEQKQIEQRQSAKIDQVVATVNEPNGLAGMIARNPVRSWFGLEFLLIGGLSFTAARRLNRKYSYRRDPVTDDEYESLTIASWVLNKFLGRRTIDQPQPPDPPMPGPPDNYPPLRRIK